MGFLFGRQTQAVTAQQALPGRPTRPYSVSPTHVVLGTPLDGPWPPGSEVLHLAMGCFWGVERIFWRQPGVIVTAAGYMGGFTPHPTYEETCTGMTGHAETVRVVYDPAHTSAQTLLKAFWENHDPTQGARQGNDVGTAYRSAIYWTTTQQQAAAMATRDAFQRVLHGKGYGEITTEIRSAAEAGEFYLAEDYHQGYLHKNPAGYCNHGPNGCTLPELP
ncbi:MAG: peptide-methionine (S)-S-oxide reductase MsrA [Candidatus Phosphoribacter sp.]|nr:peptide-methionine (S)-S-oxide reductase MsrA [Actinomycetales bacterium]